MNSAMKQPAKLLSETKEYTGKSCNKPKRQREEDDAQAQGNPINRNPKRRQTKTLFRPWCDSKTTASAMKTTHNKVQPYMDGRPAPPTPLTPYQMAVQQQQLETTFAIQQAYYERHYIMTNIWALLRQQYYQQMMMHQQQQIQQQLFLFGQQQQQHQKGHKEKH